MSSDNELLEIQPVVRIGDNPCELLVASCCSCGEQASDSREKLSQEGWRLAVEARIVDHPGFLLCPDCSDRDYNWSDLY